MNCSVENCENDAFCRTWCRKHYMRWWTHGDVSTLLMVRSPDGEPEEFLRTAKNYRGDDCLLWPFSRNNHGYAQINNKTDGKSLVSRLICIDAWGLPPSDEHHCAHSCGNGNLGCIASNHLRWATPLENAADMVAHGRSQRGEKSFCNRLKESQVIEVYRRVHTGEVQHELAAEFGVSQTLISKIKLGKLWDWLTKPEAAKETT